VYCVQYNGLFADYLQLYLQILYSYCTILFGKRL
jgi:hypothetical protein